MLSLNHVYPIVTKGHAAAYIIKTNDSGDGIPVMYSRGDAVGLIPQGQRHILPHEIF